MKLVDAAAQLEALGNPTRLSVFRLLVRAGEAGMTVGQLQKKLSIAASTLSHHLRSLLDVDLVTQERLGTTLMCRSNYNAMSALISFLVDECCADATAADCGANPQSARKLSKTPRVNVEIRRIQTRQ